MRHLIVDSITNKNLKLRAKTKKIDGNSCKKKLLKNSRTIMNVMYLNICTFKK